MVALLCAAVLWLAQGLSLWLALWLAQALALWLALAKHTGQAVAGLTRFDAGRARRKHWVARLVRATLTG